MNRSDCIETILGYYGTSISRAELAEKGDAYLEHRAKLVRSYGPAPRSDMRSTSARVQRTDQEDADDRELAELLSRFDSAPALLTAYYQSDPWLHGERAATEAAREYVRQGRHRADFDGDAALIDHFDYVMSRGPRGDYQPMAPGAGVAAQTGAGLNRQADPGNLAALQASVARPPVLSYEEFMAMSDDAREAVARALGRSVDDLMGEMR